jgi:hypothetical protein
MKVSINSDRKPDRRIQQQASRVVYEWKSVKETRVVLLVDIRQPSHPELASSAILRKILWLNFEN